MSAPMPAPTVTRPVNACDRALARIEASRSRLRAAMIPAPQAHASFDDGYKTASRRWRALWRLLRSKGSLQAVVETASMAMRGWWRHQPWYPTTAVVAGAVAREAKPFIRQNPIATVAVAATLGAAAAMARPWRWGLVNSQSRQAMRGLGRWGLGQLMQAPVQMAIATALAGWISQQRERPASAPDAGQPPDAA